MKGLRFLLFLTCISLLILIANNVRLCAIVKQKEIEYDSLIELYLNELESNFDRYFKGAEPDKNYKDGDEYYRSLESEEQKPKVS